MSGARLLFEGVGRTFVSQDGPVSALAAVSFEVIPGSFTAIVGPSGCGKTTLLHIAAGLDTQFHGAFSRSPQDAVVATLFQSPRLLPWRDCESNVAFVLEARGSSRSEARRRARDMLTLVGLDEAARRYPSQLSGGMQQRVALARALAVDPDVLLMDEPFSALDELTARRLREELLELYAARPRTVLFVTHHLHEACFLAERVIVLNSAPGRKVADIPVGLPRPRAYDDPRLSEIAARVLSYIDDGRRGAKEVVDG